MKKFILLKALFFLIVLLIVFTFSSYAHETPSQETNSHKMVQFIFQIAIILAAAQLGRMLFEYFKLPAVLGEITTGIIIGPYLLGSLPLPGFSNGLFPLHFGFPISLELYGLTIIASIVLLFLVGLETNIDMFLRFSFSGTIIGLGGAIVSFILGAFAGILFLQGTTGITASFTHPLPLFFGIIATATSVSISARILSEKRKMESPEGVTVLTAAVIDDVIGIILLAVVVGITRSGHVAWKQISFIAIEAITIWIGFTFLGLLFSRHISSLLKKFKDNNTITIMSVACALFLAGIFEKAGLAMIIGAYVMGLSLSKTDLSYIIQEHLSILFKFFIPIFFCVMGMFVNLGSITTFTVLVFGFLYVVLSIIGKIVGCGIPALFLNFTVPGALRVGIGMVPRAEVALIIAGIGLSCGALDQQAFSIIILLTFITTLISPPLLSKLLDSKKPTLRKEKQRKSEQVEITYSMPNPETAELIVNKVIQDFEQEGFYINLLEIPEKVYQLRKDTIFITMNYSPDKLLFSTLKKNEAFIHTVFYEVAAELEHVMKNLQTLTDKEKIAKNLFSKESESTTVSTNIIKVIHQNGIKVNLESTTKESIIEELLDLLVTSGQLSGQKKSAALKDLLERESILSTGMQDGIALPHAKSATTNQLISAIGVNKQGIDFNSFDKQPATIFVLTLSPTAYPEPYLQYMAEMTKFLHNTKNRDRILSCKTPNEIFNLFKSK
ncbi:cation:proton antiporter [Chlamydiota bacterium]